MNALAHASDSAGPDEDVNRVLVRARIRLHRIWGEIHAATLLHEFERGAPLGDVAAARLREAQRLIAEAIGLDVR
ncbi:MAG: hypothetical protein ABI859_16535 [Pseudomonadota bacterium]